MPEEFRPLNEIINPDDVLANSGNRLYRGSDLLENIAHIIDDDDFKECLSELYTSIESTMYQHNIQKDDSGELLIDFNILKANENIKGWQKGQFRFKVNIEISGHILTSEPILPESPLDDIRQEINKKSEGES